MFPSSCPLSSVKFPVFLPFPSSYAIFFHNIFIPFSPPSFLGETVQMKDKRADYAEDFESDEGFEEDARDRERFNEMLNRQHLTRWELDELFLEQ